MTWTHNNSSVCHVGHFVTQGLGSVRSWSLREHPCCNHFTHVHLFLTVFCCAIKHTPIKQVTSADDMHDCQALDWKSLNHLTDKNQVCSLKQFPFFICCKVRSSAVQTDQKFLSGVFAIEHKKKAQIAQLISPMIVRTATTPCQEQEKDSTEASPGGREQGGNQSWMQRKGKQATALVVFVFYGSGDPMPTPTNNHDNGNIWRINHFDFITSGNSNSNGWRHSNSDAVISLSVGTGSANSNSNRKKSDNRTKIRFLVSE